MCYFNYKENIILIWFKIFERYTKFILGLFKCKEFWLILLMTQSLWNSAMYLNLSLCLGLYKGFGVPSLVAHAEPGSTLIFFWFWVSNYYNLKDKKTY